MANYSVLKAAVQAVVKTNGNQEITGANMQSTLISIINSLGTGYQFMGVATPSTSPGTPDYNVAYIGGAGTYANFGTSVTVPVGSIGVFKYNGSWTKETITMFAGIDDVPTAGSDNLVKSGGVYQLAQKAYENEADIRPLRYVTTNNFFLAYAGTFSTSQNYAGCFIKTMGATTFKITAPAAHYVIYTFLKTLPINSGDAADYATGATRNSIINTTHTGQIPSDANYIYVAITYNNEDRTPSVLLLDDFDYIAGFKKQAFQKINDINKQFEEKRVTGVSNEAGVAFVFDDYPFVRNTTYMIKHISGYLGSIASSPSDTTTLSTDEWVEFTPLTNNTPYIYTNPTTGKEAPTIDVVVKDTIKGEIVVLESDIDEIEKQFEKEQMTGVANQAGLAFMFADYPFVKNTTYMVKHISGYLGALSTSTSDMTPLITGEWVEFTPLTTNTPYIYASPTSGKVAPVIEVTLKSTIEGEIAELNSKIYDVKQGVKYTQINVSRDGTSKHGLTIHYSGLTAIADALDSITDASEYNRYRVHVEGVFVFTNPLDVPMIGGGEYSIIYMKDYVDIEGDGGENSVLVMDFPANATFHDGKTYSDYQPIYLRRGQKVSGLKIIAKNCRYAFHIEQDGSETYNKTIDIENCDVTFKGKLDYSEFYGNCFGTGIASGQTWNIKNCIIDGGQGNVIAMHTPLSYFDRAANINMINCLLRGNIQMQNYQEGNNVFLHIENCTTNDNVQRLVYQYWNTSVHGTNGDYTTILTNANTLKGIYYTNNLAYDRGQVLRVSSLSTGTSSTIRFDSTASAFSVIVGNTYASVEEKTIYGWQSIYGYVFRDGGVDLSGQAFGTIDVDEESSLHTSLASLLGDCSSTNKVLKVSVDGVQYTITFNEDYTSQDNDYVLGKINAVIGSVATADVFCPARLYYPSINGLKLVVSVDTGAILKGMGVVFVSGGMRRAKNTDGYIDGVCLDDTSNGQMGRVITCGCIHAQCQATNDISFTTYDTMSVSPINNIGKTLGISTTTDGQFVMDATLIPLLRCKDNYLEILK